MLRGFDGQAELLPEGARAILRATFGEDPKAPLDEYPARRNELIDELLLWPGIDAAVVPRRVAADCLDWMYERLCQFVDERIRLHEITARCRELIERLAEIYAIADEHTELPLEAARELDLLLIEYERTKPSPPLADSDAAERDATVEPFDITVTDMLDVLGMIRDEMRPALAADLAARREAERAQRLAAHRRPEPVAPMQGRICSTCKRRPARVDDKCKRCAFDLGILPHGKIGEAEAA